MGKILGSWSGMRKYLEQEMTADSIKGRIRYECTSYKGMDGSHIFTIFIDGRKFKHFSWETVNSYFIDRGMKRNNDPYGVHEYWEEFWELIRRVPVTQRSEYTDNEFCDALTEYRCGTIGHSLTSEDPIVRMFAVLDRRTGKRTLEKLRDITNDQPLWLQEIFRLRFDAENIA